MKNLGRWGAGILAAVLVLSAAALAGDPPGRVARLQYMSGEVSVQPGGVNDWAAGVINRPLTTADRLWTDKNSQAELHLGTAVLRVSSETSLTVTNLTDGTAQVELDQGTINLRVRHLFHGEIYEIDTPNIAFTVMKSGEYRFDVDPNGDTTLVTVRRGEGEATGLGRAVKVKHGQTARFTGGPSLTHEIYEARGFDGFDDWCRVRDKREDYSQSVRYVSPGMIGVEDLDDYGTWRVVPSYGAIWVPAVAPGWAPYHYGHWAWVEPWGWTWIDDAPWGFAPCHYGRWVYYSNYWAWVPGPVAVRPVYAPALVAWVGGSNWGVGLALGGGPAVGWFPLGYGEPYLPPYGASRNYFRNVNVSNTRITNITNVTNNYYNATNVNNTSINSNNTITKNNTTIVTNNNTNITKSNTTNIADNSININGNHNNVHINYANQKVPGAVTAVPSTVLTKSEPVAKSAFPVREHELKEASIEDAPRVAPSRSSILGANAGERAAAPPAESESRKVFAKLPAPPKPVPFSVKEQELGNHPGRPLDSKAEDELRTKLQQQPAGMPGETETKHPSPSSVIETKSDARPAVKNPEISQPVAKTPGHMVPRPPEKNQAPAAAAEERAVAHPENRQGGNADTPRSQVRIVPGPPEKVQIEKPPAASAEKPVAQPSENRPAANAQNERVQDHVVPRPPEHATTPLQGSEPVISTPRAQPRIVPEPPTSNAGSQPSANPAGTQRDLPRRDPVQVRPAESQPSAPGVRDHIVPRPPEHGVMSAPSAEPVVTTPRAQPGIVPQPPTTSAAPQPDRPRRDPVQARPAQPQATTQPSPIVPRPPQRAPAAPAAYEPVVSTPRAQPRIVPRPATNSAAPQRNMLRRDPVQVRPPQAQANAPRSPFTPPPAPRPSWSSAQPRAASPARQAAPAASSARSQAPSAAPAAHAQQSKSTQNTDQRH